MFILQFKFYIVCQLFIQIVIVNFSVDKWLALRPKSLLIEFIDYITLIRYGSKCVTVFTSDRVFTCAEPDWIGSGTSSLNYWR